MSIPSAAEQALLDEDRHSVDLWLSIYQPSTALACRVNGAYDATNQVFNYDGVTEGSHLNVHEYDFQVMLFGS